MTRTEATRRGRKALLVSTVCLLGLALTGCQSTSSSTHEEELAPEDDAPIFSSSMFGVAASPRVTRLKKVPKGGGRDQVGKPYMVKGKWYYPKEEPGYAKSGTASWYGANFHGRLTANGEVYDMYHLSAAHPTFPLPSYARVTNRKTGASVTVRVNDRGPYVHNRLVDVSSRAAQLLGFQNDGVADVKLEYIGRAPLEGDDTPMLMASYKPGSVKPEDAGLATGVMVAEAKPSRWPSFLTAAFSPRRDSEPASAAAATTTVASRTVRQSAPTAAASRSSAPAEAATATAFSAPAAAPTPRPASIEDLIDSYDAPGVDMPRIALGYAAAMPMSGSAGAISAIAPAAREGTRIEIGRIDDVAALLTLEGLAAGFGELTEQRSAEGSSFSMVVADGRNVDASLQRLWAAGFQNAFALRDE